jgi:hypothetical protein
MVVISIAIYPVELQPLRDFGSEEDFASPQKGGNTFICRFPASAKKNLKFTRTVFLMH